MSIRILACIVLVILGFVGPWWLLAVAAFFYAFRYVAYELLVLGCMLDLSYGAGAAPFPALYTIAALALVLFAAVVKPRLNFKTHAAL
jgi:hypothetical protein